MTGNRNPAPDFVIHHPLLLLNTQAMKVMLGTNSLQMLNQPLFQLPAPIISLKLEKIAPIHRQSIRQLPLRFHMQCLPHTLTHIGSRTQCMQPEIALCRQCADYIWTSPRI